RRLRSIGLRRRHASERLQRKHHMTQPMDRVVNVLSDFQMSLSSARESIVVRRCEFVEFRLRRKLVSNSAKLASDTVIEILPEDFSNGETRGLLSIIDLCSNLFPGAVLLHLFTSLRIVLCLIEKIRDPRRDRFD